jgi:WD40 repeat protein
LISKYVLVHSFFGLSILPSKFLVLKDNYSRARNCRISRLLSQQFSANSNGYVNIYDANTFQVLYQYTYSNNIPTSVKFSKNSAYIGIGYKNTANIQILNAVPPFSVFRTIGTGMNSANPTVAEVDFKYDNSQIVACGDDRIKTFYLSNGNTNMNVNPSGGGSLSVACRYSPNDYLALSYANNRIFIFDASGN